MPPQSFDIIVLGTGPAAGQVAARSAEAGRSVAMIEPHGVGGNCALRGCNPKKVLVHAAALQDAVQRNQSRLIDVEASRIPWPRLIDFTREFVEPVSPRALSKFTSKGIHVLEETARFLGPTTIAAGDHRLQAPTIVVATGAEPAPLTFPGAELVTSSDDFLTLPQLPPRVLFLGGGYISFEFAHVAARAGARVTIVHRGERPLKSFEPDLVDRLVAHTRSIGIAVELDTEPKGLHRDSDGALLLTARRGHKAEPNQTVSYQADLIVHGAGRTPALRDLDLEAAGVESEAEGITVTDALRSVSNPHVFAAGDCAATGQPKLTPVADEQGAAIARTLIDGRDSRPHYGPVPRVVFTVPPLAAIGLTEHEAASRGLPFEVRTDDSTKWTTNRKVNAGVAGYKILVEKGTGRILGAHLLGPDADETINLFALAMRFDLTADNLQSTLYVYPTFSADIRKMLSR